MNLTFQKTRAREKAKAKRAAVFGLRAGPELIRHWPAIEMRGQSVAGFWPMGTEINVLPLLGALQESGQDVSLPRIVRKAYPLNFRQYLMGDDLKRGAYGTREPYLDKAEMTPQVVLVPLLAYTAMGMRLGYGGGYYDRTLAQLRAGGDVFACGVAFSGQETPQIPIDQYDQKLDGVLTEAGFRKF